MGGCGCGGRPVNNFIEEASLYEASFRILASPYDFFIRGLWIAGRNVDAEGLGHHVAKYFVTNTPIAIEVLYFRKLYDILVSQTYSDKDFKTYYWTFVPSMDGYISTLTLEKWSLYSTAEFYIKGLPEIFRPMLPYMVRDLMR